MNRHSIAAATALALSLFGGSVLAADVAAPPPQVAPVYRAPVSASYNWSGFYLGVNAGYGWAKSAGNATLNSPIVGVITAASSGSANGALAGGQIGVNWQTGMFVFGAEGDLDWSWQKRNTTTGCGSGCTLTETGGIDWFGTARLRAGVAFDRVLVYGTGGLAWSSASDNLDASGFGVTANILNLSANKIGWTVGGGAEYAFLDNLTAKIEYLYISTSNVTNTAALSPLLGGGTVTDTANVTDSIVRFGLNYKIGGSH